MAKLVIPDGCGIWSTAASINIQTVPRVGTPSVSATARPYRSSRIAVPSCSAANAITAASASLSGVITRPQEGPRRDGSAGGIDADENVWRPLAEGLRRCGRDVTTANGDGTLGYSDRDHLEFADPTTPETRGTPPSRRTEHGEAVIERPEQLEFGSTKPRFAGIVIEDVKDDVTAEPEVETLRLRTGGT